jgi:hypothetical protein
MNIVEIFNEYTWQIIAAIVVVFMAIVGFIADKTDFGKKGMPKKDKKAKQKEEPVVALPKTEKPIEDVFVEELSMEEEKPIEDVFVEELRMEELSPKEEAIEEETHDVLSEELTLDQMLHGAGIPEEVTEPTLEEAPLENLVTETFAQEELSEVLEEEPTLEEVKVSSINEEALEEEIPLEETEKAASLDEENIWKF